MHSAVELILCRMKSNPDDFKGNSRWMQAVNDYKKHFTEEENKAVMDAIRELRMTQLQEKLFELLGEYVNTPAELPPLVTEAPDIVA